MLNRKSSEDAMKAGEKVEREINFIYYFYYPCSLAEEIIWTVIDGRNY
jgi:hypothetical protein